MSNFDELLMMMGRRQCLCEFFVFLPHNRRSLLLLLQIRGVGPRRRRRLVFLFPEQTLQSSSPSQDYFIGCLAILYLLWKYQEKIRNLQLKCTHKL